MGAWGSGIFENDSAHDWLAEAMRSASVENTVAETLGATKTDIYLEIDDGQRALAAAALVAGSLKPNTKYSLIPIPGSLARLDLSFAEATQHLALEAVARVADASNSELADLWGDDQIFIAVISTLRSALQAHRHGPQF